MLLAGIVTWAAISDLLRGTIPNAANTAMFVLWVAWVISGAETSVGYSFLIGAGVFAFGAVLFQFGQMGGGDVKMLTALAIWAGPSEFLVFLIQVALRRWRSHHGVAHTHAVRRAGHWPDAVQTTPTGLFLTGVAIAAGAYLMIARLCGLDDPEGGSKMNVRMILLVGFALFSAAATFFLAKTWIDSQRDAIRRQAESLKPTTTESVNVLVAKADLPSGLIVKRDHMEWKPWPEKGVGKNFLMEGRDKMEDVSRLRRPRRHCDRRADR